VLTLSYCHFNTACNKCFSFGFNILRQQGHARPVNCRPTRTSESSNIGIAVKWVMSTIPYMLCSPIQAETMTKLKADREAQLADRALRKKLVRTCRQSMQDAGVTRWQQNAIALIDCQLCYTLCNVASLAVLALRGSSNGLACHEVNAPCVALGIKDKDKPPPTTLHGWYLQKFLPPNCECLILQCLMVLRLRRGELQRHPRRLPSWRMNRERSLRQKRPPGWMPSRS